MQSANDKVSTFGSGGAASEYLEIKRGHVFFFKQTRLFMQIVGGDFVVFKPTGVGLAEKGYKEEDLPRHLFIKRQDRDLAIGEVQKGMADGRLRQMITTGDQAGVRHAFVSLLEEAFLKPRLGVVSGFKGMLGVMVSEYLQDPKLLKAFLLVAEESYSLAEHSVNVMALVVGYAIHRRFTGVQMVDLAIAGLLHDIGKTKLPDHQRFPTDSLSEADFARYRNHPLEGVAILKKGEFGENVLLGVGQHHERLDGGGYPKGIKKVSEFGQIVGLADCYEVLTSQLPTGHKVLNPLESLMLLKKEADQGKFSLDMFVKFAYSLTS